MTPPGSAGYSDVTVTTPQGSTTLSRGFQYLTSVEVFPIVGKLEQIVYDKKRNRLYLPNVDHNQVEVFSLASKSLLSPIPTGRSPVSIALSPDDAKLAVANALDGTVTVIDPDSSTVLHTYSVLGPDDLNPICGWQVSSLTAVKSQRMFVEIVCTNLLDQGATHLLDLNTGSLNCAGLFSCSSDGITFGGLLAMTATPDGSKVATLSGVLDLDANSTTPSKAAIFPPLAVNLDASIVSARIQTPLGPYGWANFDAQQDEFSFLHDPYYLPTGFGSAYELLGTHLNPSGSLILQPSRSAASAVNAQTLGIDVSDVHTGRLTLRVALPDFVAPNSGPMAADDIGNRFFFVTDTGITVVQIGVMPLSVVSATPSAALPGAQITIRGSGFEPGATVRFGDTTSPQVSTFVDQNTLQIAVPILLPGPARVTVTNPDGKQYSFDDLLNVQ